MTDMKARMEIAEFNIRESYENEGTEAPQLANSVYTNMARAYLEGIQVTGRGIHEVDGQALTILSWLAKSAVERVPTPEYALQACKAAFERYAFYLPMPSPQEAFDSMTGIDRDSEAMQGQGLNPVPTPFSEAMGGRLGADMGIVSPRTPEPPEGRPYAPRSGAQLFGELMLAFNGDYQRLEGVKFPPDWTPEEAENYIRYKRELEARHLAARQRTR